jgi:beta-lactam-binding protein with PASTA domain
VTDENDDGTVVDQRPGSGAEVEKGRDVIIVVGRLEEQPEPVEPPPGGAPQQ